MLRFSGMLTLTPKPKKAPCAKAGANHVRAYFLLIEYHPAIDQQRLTGHIIGIRAGEIRDAGGDIFWLRQAAEGDAFGEFGSPVAQRFTRRFGYLTIDLGPHRRFHNPRAVAVNGNTQRRQVAGSGLR